MEEIRINDQANGGAEITVHSSPPEPTDDLSSGGLSPSPADELRRKIDAGNVEDAVSTLRQGGLLNNDDARALLGKMEFNRGNVEAALRVFDGIDVAAVAAARPKPRRAAALHLEAILLKAKSQAHLKKFKEAALSCATILDAAEKAAAVDAKLREVVAGAAELLPELWKQAGCPREAVAAYQRALRGGAWQLDPATAARVRKELAVFLLYGGCEDDGGHLEEALRLLTIQWRMIAGKQIDWDGSVLDHLTFALSVAGHLPGLAALLRGLLPAAMPREDRSLRLALCCDGPAALQLLERIPPPLRLEALLLAAELCARDPARAERGAAFARRAAGLAGGDAAAAGLAELLLGLSLSAQARSPAAPDAERAAGQREAVAALERAEGLTGGADPRVLRGLALEHAEQRRLGLALRYAQRELRVSAGSDPDSWVLVARILSAQNRLLDAEATVNAGLAEADGWGQRRLLLTKARVQAARGQPKLAIQTYAELLALVRAWRETARHVAEEEEEGRKTEMAAWVDLARVYAGMALWRDAETCIARAREVGPASAVTWQAEGELEEARGRPMAALAAYQKALTADAGHAPSMVAAATVVARKPGGGPALALRGWLCDALRLDRTSPAAWLALGRLRAAEGRGRAAADAADCFQAAALLQHSAPVEPFR